MRITKKEVANIRTRLDRRVKDVFKLDDEHLGKFLKTLWSNVVLGTREENLRVVVLLSIQEFIPDSMTF